MTTQQLFGFDCEKTAGRLLSLNLLVVFAKSHKLSLKKNSLSNAKWRAPEEAGEEAPVVEAPGVEAPEGAPEGEAQQEETLIEKAPEEGAQEEE